MPKSDTQNIQVKVSIPHAGEFLLEVPIDIPQAITQVKKFKETPKTAIKIQIDRYVNDRVKTEAMGVPASLYAAIKDGAKVR